MARTARGKLWSPSGLFVLLFNYGSGGGTMRGFEGAGVAAVTWPGLITSLVNI